MKTIPAARRSSSAAPLRSRPATVALLAALALGSLCALPLAQAQTITSAVPAFLSYQGRVTTPAGALVGAGTPVNRTVTFRIWSHATNSLAADLVYSEQQIATISEGEFSVLIGQGNATAGTPLGYAENTKGKPTVTIADAGVFGGATRYLGVTVDDGNTGTVDPEISPRQQIVTSAFAFRAKFAESLGANGTSTLTTLDNGNVGIATANPTQKLHVTGNTLTTGNAYLLDGNHSIRATAGVGISLSTFMVSDGLILRQETGNVGIGVTAPVTKLEVNGNIAASAAGGYVFGGGDTDTGMFSPGDNNILFKTGNVERVRFLSNGHVGIGIANPGFQLDVRSTVAHGAEMAIGDNFGGKGALYFGNTSHGLKRNFGSTANDIGLFTTDGKIHLSAAGATAGQFVLTTAGDVGIGTSAPTAPFHISRTNSSGTTGFHVMPGTLYGVNTLNAVTLDVPGTASGTMAVWDNFGASGTVRSSGFTFNGPGDADGGIFSNADNTMTFHTNAAERMRIVGDAVGLARTDPQARLDVNGSVMAATDGGFVFRNDNDTGMFTTGNDANTIAFRTASVNRMWVTGDGRVGIGNAGPGAPLHVSNSVTYTNIGLSAYFDGAGANHNDFTSTQPYSIIADSRVRSGSGFDVLSDARIKRIIGQSDGAADLAALLKIEITDYTFKDTLAKSGRTEKKVIAQQIEAIAPHAVHRTTDVVPDIFQKATIDADGWIALATDLKVGERVRILAGTTQDLHEVLAVEPARFRTTLQSATDKAFVYGREVSDFRTVDYDALAMLNVSATQQLKRDTDTELKSLRAENAALRAELAALAAKENARDAKLAAIERLLAAPNTVMARPAAAPASTTQQ